MPVMDGIEATRQIRLSQRTVPIIALTANVISSEHQKLINAGVNHVLLKPINDDELYHTIEGFLSEEIISPLPAARKQSTTDIEKYNISGETLNNELLDQLRGLQAGFDSKDIKLMRHHSHQLLGLAGLYEIPELEVVGHKLHDALLTENFKQIWKELWQTKRIIEHKQFETLE